MRSYGTVFEVFQRIEKMTTSKIIRYSLKFDRRDFYILIFIILTQIISRKMRYIVLELI